MNKHRRCTVNLFYVTYASFQQRCPEAGMVETPYPLDVGHGRPQITCVSFSLIEVAVRQGTWQEATLQSFASICGQRCIPLQFQRAKLFPSPCCLVSKPSGGA